MKVRLFVFLPAILICGIISETSAAPLELITASEAARPNLPLPKNGIPGESSGFHARAPMPGAPRIIVEKPKEGGAVSTPFPVQVQFIPSPGAKIDLQTLKIDVLKLIRISLLSRVRPYVTEKGINVPEAKVPPGTYRIEIAVADDRGRIGSTIETWIVD